MHQAPKLRGTILWIHFESKLCLDKDMVVPLCQIPFLSGVVQVNRIQIPCAPCKSHASKLVLSHYINAWKSMGSVCSTVTRTLPRRSLSSPPRRWELQQGHPVRVPPLLSNLCGYLIFDAENPQNCCWSRTSNISGREQFLERNTDFLRFLPLANLAMLRDNAGELMVRLKNCFTLCVKFQVLSSELYRSMHCYHSHW